MPMGEFMAAMVAVSTVAATATSAWKHCCQCASHDEIEYEMVPLQHQRQCIPFQPSDITIGRVIGSGAFSTVFQATFKQTNQTVALKVQKTDVHVQREREIIEHLHHESISRHLGSCEYEDSLGNVHIWMISDMMAGGDLSKVLSSLSVPQTIQIALDVAQALKYLHAKNIVHRDIKCSNILLNADNRARLCDFGFARELELNEDDSARRRKMTLCGTEAYMAPEIYFEEPFDERIDIFSYGVVLIEMICRRHINQDNFLMRTPAKQFQLDMEEFRQHVPPSYPSSIVCLAEMCIAMEPQDRPSAAEIVDWLHDLKLELDSDSSSDVETYCSEDLLHGPSITLTSIPRAPPVYEGRLEIRPSSESLWMTSIVSMSSSQIQFMALNQCVSLDPSNAPNIVIQDTRQWTIQTNDNPDGYECLASSEIELELWIAMLNHAIKTAASSSPGNNAEDCADDSNCEVNMWLRSLGLSHYGFNFTSKGFKSLDYLRETGLEEDDFNFLEIEDMDDRITLSEAIAQMREE